MMTIVIFIIIHVRWLLQVWVLWVLWDQTQLLCGRIDSIDS